MRVLVTGASGFVGSALCGELLARGHSVRAAVRRPGASAQRAPELHEICVPDLAGEFDRRELLGGVDAIVHLAALAHRNVGEAELRHANFDATVRLAESATGLVRRFVFVSSVKVHGEESGERAFVETDGLRPEDAYGRSKLDAERFLTDWAARSGMELALVRPPLVYGPGAKANFLRLLRWIDSGLPLPFAGLRNRRSLICLGNLVDVLARCVAHPAALGAFLVSDDGAVSTPDLLSRTARALERPARLVPVPSGVLKLAGAITGRSREIRSLTASLEVDASKARRVLEWRPRWTLDEGLAETVRWFRSFRS
jgi:UDP-N-acetyl-alpha-D-quinovosamine dehydrogenase